MAVTDTKLRNLKPQIKPYQQTIDGGLFMEVMPGGAKPWRLRYRLAGKQEKVTLGEYPAYSLAEACTWRDESKSLARRGISPMGLKRGDSIPEDAVPIAKEMAESYVRKWCTKSLQKLKAREAEARSSDLVETFAWRWYEEIAEPTNSSPRNIKRILDKDVIPVIGQMQLEDVSVTDILRITDAIKARGSDQMALQTRNVLKRLFAYAIARQKITFNPAAAIEAKYIASAKSRDVALTANEIGRLLRAIYQSSMRRANKLALHLLILCMVRKSELIEAQWDEIDFENKEWAIPGERMKKERPHLVPLSDQALAMLEELKGLACGSNYIFPSRNTLKKPDGKPMSAAQFLESLYGTLPDFFKDEDELRAIWSVPDTRKALLAGLAEKGFSKEPLSEMQHTIEAEDSDLFDVLAYVAFAMEPVTREQRAASAKDAIHTSFNDKQQAFLDFVLAQYVKEGVDELDQEKLSPLLKLKYKNAIADAMADLGNPEQIRKVFVGFQKYLYL